jgi:hypothetical protein
MTRSRSAFSATVALFIVATVSAAQSVGRIEGSVADSLRGGPLAGATVVATPAAAARDTTFHSAQTDSRGHFLLSNLGPGAWQLSVEHARIDSTGIGAPSVSVTIAAHDTVPAQAFLAIPSAATLRRALCAAAARDSSLGVMLGALRSADGTPVPGARLVISWDDFDVDRKTATVTPHKLLASVTSDASGVYRACGLPVQRSLFVQAQVDSTTQSGIVEEQIGATGVMVRDFRVGDATPAFAASAVLASRDSTPAAGTELLAGTVTTLNGSPIPSAQVSLLGSGRAVTTNERGEFRLSGVSRGTAAVHVIALGYYPQIKRVDVGGDQIANIRMENAAVVLDSMRVIARRSIPISPMQNEFEQRRKRAFGTALSAEQIAAFNPMHVTDIFKHVNGVRVVKMAGQTEPVVISTRGRVTFINGPPTCPLTVYLDGIKLAIEEINIMAPKDLYGVEVYTVAGTPAQYRAGPCGVMLLWSK